MMEPVFQLLQLYSIWDQQ